MTLQTYNSQKLEELAFRFFDLAAQFRNMAKKARRNHLEEIPLHDKKILLWCNHLEIWAKKSQTNLDIMISELPHKKKEEFE